MALVPIKTSTGTGYCACICGCYQLISVRDEETGRGFCPTCAEQHIERNRELVRKMPKKEPAWKSASLPPGARAPAMKEYGREYVSKLENRKPKARSQKSRASGYLTLAARKRS